MLILHDRRTVNIARNIPIKGIIDQIVFRCRRKILHASHNICNAHHMIINDIRKVIGREAIALDQDLFIQCFIFNCNMSEDLVIKRSCSFGRNCLTNDKSIALSNSCFTFCRCKKLAWIIILERFTACFLQLSLCIDHIFIAEAVMSAAFSNQFLGVLHINAALDSFRLHIRTILSADIRSFIMFQVASLQCFINNICCTFNQTSLISILDSQDKYSVWIFFRNQICIESRTKVPNMHIASRTWCKSCSNSHIFFTPLPVQFYSQLGLKTTPIKHPFMLSISYYVIKTSCNAYLFRYNKHCLLGYSQAVRQLALNQSFREFESLYPSLISISAKFYWKLRTFLRLHQEEWVNFIAL